MRILLLTLHIAILLLAGWVSLVAAQINNVAPATIAPTPNAPINKAAVKNKIKVACVGDSITQGVGTTAPKGSSNAYPTQLQRMLGNKYEVVNFGVSATTLLNKGDNPYQQQEAFRRAKEYKPDVVIIMLGTNDTKPQNWKFKDEFAADYLDLVCQFARLDRKPRIFVCHPCYVPGDGNFGINQPAVEMEIPIIDEVAREQHVDIIDMTGATRGHDDLIPDRVHPNSAGAAILAKTAFKALTGKDYGGPFPTITDALAPAMP